jgi:hypothetical protein
VPPRIYQSEVVSQLPGFRIASPVACCASWPSGIALKGQPVGCVECRVLAHDSHRHVNTPEATR